MAKIIESIYIENFRGINKADIRFDSINIFIGDNGTGKTSILEAINFAFSPSFLSGHIKSTDFYEGTNNQIKIEVKTKNKFKIELPDGYTKQEIECNRIFLTIKKRERKTKSKILSDLVAINHIVLPVFKAKKNENGTEYWEIERKNDKSYKFTSKLLSFNVFDSDEIPKTLYFSKERDKQLSKDFNTTFSFIIEDLNWRYLKKLYTQNLSDDFFSKIDDIEKEILSKTEIDKHDFIREFNKRVIDFNLESVDFSFLEKSAPFNQSFLSKNNKKINLPLKYLGSGIEMIYAILLLDTFASLSKEKILIIIDEPELNLHPNLQEKLAKYLLKLSKENKYQIFISTHSPILFKTLVNKPNVNSVITQKVNSNIELKEYNQKKSIFPWGPTWGEINYFAYNYPTVEFHNELYGYLQEITGYFKCDDLDNYLMTEHQIKKEIKWIIEKNGKPQSKKDVTLMTFIRHMIHHPENKKMSRRKGYCIKKMKESIDKMVDVIKKRKA